VPDSAQCNKSPDPEVEDPNARLERNTDSIFPLPDALKTDGSDLIVAEVEYDHTPIVGLISPSNKPDDGSSEGFFTLGDRIYLRPRTAIEGF